MKKFLVLLVCLMASFTTTFAQSKGDASVGLNLNYAGETSFGMGTRFQYNITDNIRLEPEFNYYFKHDHLSAWDLGANIAYLFPIADDVVIYPMAGAGYMGIKPEGFDSDGCFQAKFGAGIEFKILPTTKIIIEPKYQIIDDIDDQFVITAGISYCF